MYLWQVPLDYNIPNATATNATTAADLNMIWIGGCLKTSGGREG